MLVRSWLIIGCYLDAVGIPVLHAQSQYSSKVGSWMKDSEPRDTEVRIYFKVG